MLFRSRGCEAPPPKAGGDPEGAGDAVPPNNKREGVAPGTVGSHALDGNIGIHRLFVCSL
jgi:hypothetical protein